MEPRWSVGVVVVLAAIEGSLFLYSRDDRHAGIEQDEQHDEAADESSENNVRQRPQFAVSVFSMEPMTFTASVDIGTAAFLNCYWLFLGSMAGARHRGRGRLITDRRKCPDPRRPGWPRQVPLFRNGER